MLLFDFINTMSASSSLSPARLAANRANAQLSCGPKTPEGKAIASSNALKTGLTGRTVLLPGEDAQAYEDHILKFVEGYQPVGDLEIRLVQSMADTQWRLDRIPGLECGMFALGRLKYADLFDQLTDPKLRDQLLDAHILQADAKHFKNLHLQESRLRRQYRQDLAELQTRQKERQEREAAANKAKALAASSHGFEFATPETQPQSSQTEPLPTTQTHRSAGAASNSSL